MIRRLRGAFAIAVCLALGGATLTAQPFTAQIQAALRWLLGSANTWTGTNTFTGTVVIGSLSPANITLPNGGQVRSDTTSGHTFSLAGYSGAVYTPLFTAPLQKND